MQAFLSGVGVTMLYIAIAAGVMLSARAIPSFGGVQLRNCSYAGLNVRTFSISFRGVAFLPTRAFFGKCS